ncbi:glycine cleavage system protein GcvH [Streptacidiphilus neutrinimicus]|uniref:glycine cleavage system protein GcvH n=1 Tax=Streptacidiphilus neutrinimicus TaxID=105420 RepID=UPI0005A91E5B|nr:glycine cleavage system protein GcvH [Streptacidiphilus neutrinimicus]
MTTPKNLTYTRDHEWVLLDGKSATVGITDFAQKQLGDIVFVELPEVGQQIDRGKAFGTVESVKAVTEVYAPVSGKITAVNQDLNDMPEDINGDAYEAWLIKIEVSNAKELDELMTAEKYDAYCGDE